MSKKDIVWIAVVLTLAAALLHTLHYLIFRDAHHIFIYLLGDIAFVPLEILFIAILFERVLSEREKQSRQQKMNMVIGAFFSAVGQPLLRVMEPLVANASELSGRLEMTPEWTEAQLREGIRFVDRTKLELKAEPGRLAPVREFLAQNREFMLRLLENPTLLEHERFTDLLWAVFHLEEELTARKALGDLPPSDLAHLAGDIDRAYCALLMQWLEYMVHLKRNYPYLFSFAARTNPLQPDAQPEVV
jgi:hypothetical protein